MEVNKQGGASGNVPLEQDKVPVETSLWHLISTEDVGFGFLECPRYIKIISIISINNKVKNSFINLDIAHPPLIYSMNNNVGI